MEENLEKIIKDGHILIHPLRYKIIKLLQENNPEGMYVNEISKAIKEDRKLVAYHLLTLFQYDFAKSEYEISKYPASKGKALKRITLTEKTKKALTDLKETISNMNI